MMPKYTCACGATYKFHATSAGKKARCKKCGAVFSLPDTDDPPDGTIAIAADDPFTQEVTKTVATQGELYIPPSSPGAVTSGILGSSIVGAVEPPTRSFTTDVLWTFLFPTTANNFVTFVMLLITLVVASFFASIKLFGLIHLVAAGLYVAVIGWYCAYRFSILTSAAGGDEELPGFVAPTNWLIEAFQAMFKWFGSWIVVLIPAIAYRIWYWSAQPVTPPMATGPGVMQPAIMPGSIIPDWMNDITAAAEGLSGIMALPPDGLDPFKILVVLGLFLWPFVALCVALGGFRTLVRFDLMLVTVGRTIGVYSIMVVLIWVAFFLEHTLSTLTSSKAAAVAAATGTPATTFGATAVGGICVLGVGIYFDIVLMRLIGLYYHHFKKKFAWNWG